MPLILSSPRRIVIRVRVGRRACPRDSRSPRGRPSGHYAGQSIKIVDVHSGAIVRELTYKHFGPTSEVLLSRQTGTLATVNAWRSPSENRADIEKPQQLLVFRLDQTKPLCVIEHFPQAQGTISGDPVQASMDLSLIGVYLSDRITVYEIANCSLVAGSNLRRQRVSNQRH